MSDGASAKWRLPSVLFEVTSRCNLQCSYCYNVYNREGCRTPEPGNFDTAMATLHRLFELAAVDSVTMSGGEPFLAERFTDIVAFCRKEGKSVLITSNGNGGTDEQLTTAVRLGVRTFVMPCHSLRAEEHDAMTGVQGSHGRALQSLLHLKQLGASPAPIIVLTRLNYQSITETLCFLKEQGFRRMIVNRFNFGGRGLAGARQITLSVAELRNTYDRVNDMAARCGLWVTSNVCTPHCVLDPDRYLRIGFGACDIQFRNRPLTLDVHGNVRFCNHSPVRMGNIFEQSIEEILSTPYAHRWESTVPEFCADCTRWEKCVGGCRAAAEQMGLDMTHVDPIALMEPHGAPAAPLFADDANPTHP